MNKVFLTFSTIASAPLITASLLSFAAPAEAAFLTGKADISGGFTSIVASDGSVNFDPAGGPIYLLNGEGSFSNFNIASIKNITLIPGSGNPLVDAFLDLGFLDTSTFPGTITNPIDDGKNIFSLTEISDYVINSDEKGGSIIGLGFKGFFIGENATEKSLGRGNLSFQSEYDVDTIKSILNGTNDIKEIKTTFSGLTIATPESVPEPATMLGLGLVGATFLGSRRRKASES